jgi:hypothetical protein
MTISFEPLELGEQLPRRLPEWPIVAGKVSDANELSPKATAALKARSQHSVQEIQDVIVTRSALRNCRSGRIRLWRCRQSRAGYKRGLGGDRIEVGAHLPFNDVAYDYPLSD